MSNKDKTTLVFLWETYEELMGEIRANRKQSNSLIKRNQRLQKQASLAKENIAGIVDIEVAKEGSLYKVCKKQFGTIDRRFYNLITLLKNIK